MRGRIPIGTAALALVAAAMLLSVSAVPAGLPGEAEAASTTVDVGSDWFCDPGFENPDLNAFCETVISVGDTVTWQWTEGRHDVVECGPNWSKWNNQNEICDGADFDAGTLSSSNTTWSRTFDAPGEYWYVCTRHFPDQKGKIVVQEAAAATPTPAPTEAPTPTETPVDTEPPTDTQSPTPAVLDIATTPTPTSAPAAIPAGGGAPSSDGGGSIGANVPLALGGMAALMGAAGIFLSFRTRET
jgi:plastocyanin